MYSRYMIAPVHHGDNNLDTTGRALLQELAENARMSATRLGEKVCRSGSAIQLHHYA